MTDFHAKCPECGHVWAVVKLPMPIDEAARAMLAAFCPACGNDSPTTAPAAEIPTVKETTMQSNDNAPITASDPDLTPAARAAFEWAVTVPRTEKISDQPDCEKHFGPLSDTELLAVADALDARAAALDAERKEMLDYVVQRADPTLTPAQIKACDWACTIETNLTGHPDYLDHFGAFTPEERKQCGAELRRRGEAQKREADMLLEEGRRRFGADFMAGE